MPRYAMVFVIIMLSSVGLPGLNGFVGEFLILMGTFRSEGIQIAAPTGQLAWAGIITADLVALGTLVVLAGALARPQVREHVGPRTRIAAVLAVAAIELLLVAPPLPFAGFNGGLLLRPLAMVTGQTEAFRELFALLAVLAGTGVIFAAVYLLVATQKVFFGPIKHAENERLPDLSAREGLVLAPLVLVAVLMGVFPQPFIDIVQPSVTAYTREFRARAGLPAIAETVPTMGLQTRIAAREPVRALPAVANQQPAQAANAEGR
jgi:NADH-quinone oxidoreductase subunit M